MTNRIAWEAGRRASQVGYIHGEAQKYKVKVQLFSISRTTDLDDIKAGTPWLLAHRLPYRGVERKFGTVKMAQEHAERYLLWAMELMGFVPKEGAE